MAVAVPAVGRAVLTTVDVTATGSALVVVVVLILGSGTTLGTAGAERTDGEEGNDPNRSMVTHHGVALSS